MLSLLPFWNHRQWWVLLLGAILLLGISTTSQAQSAENTTVYLPFITNHHDPTWQWASPMVVDLTPSPINEPQLLIDREGRLHLFWATNRAPRFIYHTYWNGENWTAPAPIAPSLGTSALTQAIIVDQNGTIHVAWKNDLGSGTENRHRLLYTTFTSGTWGTEAELFHNRYGGLESLFHLDGDNVLHLTFAYSDFVRVKYYQLTQSSSGWLTSPLLDPPHAQSLSVYTWGPDQQSGVRFYSGSGGDRFYYSYWQNDQFSPSEQELQGRLWGRTLLVDSDGYLHTIWDDQVPVPGGTVRGFYYQCLDQELQWGVQTILSGQNAATGMVTTTSSTRSQIVMSWRETATQQLWVAVTQGCMQMKKIALNLILDSSEMPYAVTLSHAPHKACILTKRSSPVQYTVYCADILH